MSEQATTFEPIVLTEQAVQRVRTAMAKEGAGPEKALRLGVVGGGCSGFSYTMGFDEPKSDDAVFNFGDVTVVVDPASREYLDGIMKVQRRMMEERGWLKRLWTRGREAVRAQLAAPRDAGETGAR